MRSCVCILTAIALGACAPRQEDVTPAIEISPGAKGRIMWMDRLRHHGEVRRWLPRVTVEEVDDADLPASDLGEAPAADEAPVADDDAGDEAGAPLETPPSATTAGPPSATTAGAPSTTTAGAPSTTTAGAPSATTAGDPP